MNTLNKNELAYILLDCSVGLHVEYRYIQNIHKSIYKTEWHYLGSMRTVCRTWKEVIDTYIFRYIALKSLHIDYHRHYVKLYKDVTTIVHYESQSYKCRFSAINPVELIKYSTFIHGAYDIEFKYGSCLKNLKCKKMKRKAILNIYINTGFTDAYHKSGYRSGKGRMVNVSLPTVTRYTWTDKHGSQKVTKGWKKAIAEHFLHFILIRY